MLLENLRSFRLSVIISGRFDDTSSHSVATKMWGNYAFATRSSEWIVCHFSTNMKIVLWKHEKKQKQIAQKRLKTHVKPHDRKIWFT